MNRIKDEHPELQKTGKGAGRCGKVRDITNSHKGRRIAEGQLNWTGSPLFLTDNVSYVRITGCALFRVIPQTSVLPYSDGLSDYATVTSMQ